HRSDTQRITDRGIRSRSTPLAKYFLFIREPDDVMNREEVRGIILLPLDQSQFFFKGLSHLFRDTFRIAVLCTFPSEIFQMLLGRLAWWHRFVGIVVFDLIEGEGNPVGEFDGLFNGAWMLSEQACHFFRRFQM